MPNAVLSPQENADESIDLNINNHATETTPLLSNNKKRNDDNNDVLEDIPLLDESESHEWTERVYILKKAIPVLLTYVLQNSLQMASVFSLGHLGSVELAASALGSMYATVTGWSIVFGASTALDTLGSQAYTSGNPKMVGIYLQRAIIIIALGFIPIACIWWEAEHILIFLGQDHVISAKAALYLRCLLVGAPALVMFEVLKRYLQAQGIMHASTYVLLICSPINIFLNYVLVWYTPISIGFIGAPLAIAMTFWFMLILIVVYIKYFNGYQAWGGWSRAAFHDWRQFLLLALPGVVMVCSEWWAFELVALAAGYLGNISLATQSVVLTTVSFLYQFPFGISVASSNRIGNYLGGGLALKAKIASKVSMEYAVLIGLISTTVLIIFKDYWGCLFTNDEDVIRMTSSILPIVAVFQVSDGIGAIGCGVLRGQGRQKIGAMLNISGYYLLALPLSLFLAFKLKFGLIGLWYGLILGSFIVSVVLLYIILDTDWVREVEDCQKRMNEGEENVKLLTSDTDFTTSNNCSSNILV